MIFETINTIFVMIYQYNNIRNCDTFKVKTMLKKYLYSYSSCYKTNIFKFY